MTVSVIVSDAVDTSALPEFSSSTVSVPALLPAFTVAGGDGLNASCATAEVTLNGSLASEIAAAGVPAAFSVRFAVSTSPVPGRLMLSAE